MRAKDPIVIKKRHKMSVMHNPPETYGDCFRACLATLLGYSEINDVPHFMDANLYPKMDDTWKALDEFLTTHGLFRFTFAYRSDDLDQVLKAMKVWNQDQLYMLCGESPRGFDHEVIALNDAIWHDPHPDGGGIVKPSTAEGGEGLFWISLFTPLYVLPEP